MAAAAKFVLEKNLSPTVGIVIESRHLSEHEAFGIGSGIM